jgi:hypothetical protein
MLLLLSPTGEHDGREERLRSLEDTRDKTVALIR